MYPCTASEGGGKERGDSSRQRQCRLHCTPSVSQPTSNAQNKQQDTKKYMELQQHESYRERIASSTEKENTDRRRVRGRERDREKGRKRKGNTAMQSG